MKNFLRKILFLFVIGILSQPCIKNTCWGMKISSVKEINWEEETEQYLPAGTKIYKAIVEGKMCIETQHLVPPIFYAEYKPICHKFIKKSGKPAIESRLHASKCAITFVTLRNDNKAEITSYLFPQNFVAKGNAFTCTQCDKCITCLRYANDNTTMPLLHSEISFLQYITKLDNPNNGINENSILYKLINKHTGKTHCYIFIKNSSMLPCYKGAYGDGIYCEDYLNMFQNKSLENYKMRIRFFIMIPPRQDPNETIENYNTRLKENERKFLREDKTINGKNFEIIYSDD